MVLPMLNAMVPLFMPNGGTIALSIHHEPGIDHDNNSISVEGLQLDYPTAWETTGYIMQQNLPANPQFLWELGSDIKFCFSVVNTANTRMLLNFCILCISR